MALLSINDKLDFNEFSLLIYVVGGQGGIGEGILILFLKGNEVLKTISIDSCQAVFKGHVCNLLDNLLKHFNVKKIDCFVWTHPHNDHSEGLDVLIESYYRKGSIGVIPKQIYGNDNDIVKMSSLSQRVLKTFNGAPDKPCGGLCRC